MLLKDADGPNRLIIRVTGYQFPDALDLATRFSWHMIGGEAPCQEGSWRVHLPAPPCYESPRGFAPRTKGAPSVHPPRGPPRPPPVPSPEPGVPAVPADS